MALLLIIDTALDRAHVALYQDNECLGQRENAAQKSHASFVQPAIDELIHSAKIALSQIDAVAVTEGPGSYTGLRVGLASAKGICYALDKPLILLDTLQVMAMTEIMAQSHPENYVYAPMIDARRDEVFTAVFDYLLQPVMEPTPLQLNENSYGEILGQSPVIFSGSGVTKAKNIILHPNAIFSEKEYPVNALFQVALQKWKDKIFADVAYSQPNYLKAFYTTAKPITHPNN